MAETQKTAYQSILEARAQKTARREAQAAERRAVSAAVEPPPEDPRATSRLDRSRPFCFVNDGTNRAYQQGDGYFNKVDQWVGEVPAEKRYDHAEPAQLTIDERRAALLASAKQTIGKLERTPRVPAQVIDAMRENERALRAEARAE